MWKLKILMQYKKNFKHNSLIMQDKEKIQITKCSEFIILIFCYKKRFTI